MLGRLIGQEVHGLFLDFRMLDGSTGLDQAEDWPPECGQSLCDCGIGRSHLERQLDVPEEPASVLSQGNRSVELLAAIPRQNRPETKPAPSRDIGISNSGR